VVSVVTKNHEKAENKNSTAHKRRQTGTEIVNVNTLKENTNSDCTSDKLPGTMSDASLSIVHQTIGLGGSP